MAAARAGVLGVRWLQRAARNVVPLGARTGPREQCGKGMPEVWCVRGRVDVMDTTAAVSGQGAEVKLVCPEEGVEGLVVLRGLGSGLRSHCSLMPSGWQEERGRLRPALVCPPASHITKDMLPGPYPKTPEERAAAAKKYNMRVEDYEPYPDDGMG